MKYDIFSSKAPAMPQAGKGTLFVKFLLSQASKDMREPLIPMAFPALSAHLTDVKFNTPITKITSFVVKWDI